MFYINSIAWLGKKIIRHLVLFDIPTVTSANKINESYLQKCRLGHKELKSLGIQDF